MRKVSARTKSSPVVSFTFPASPSNTATRCPAHSASAASSVKSSRPAAAARRCASSSIGNAKACGVSPCADRCGRWSRRSRRCCRSSSRCRRQRWPERRRQTRAPHRWRASPTHPTKRSRGVMDQDDVRLAWRQGLHSRPHRSLPRGAPMHRREQIEPSGRSLEHRCIVRMDDRLHGIDGTIRSKARQARPDHRLARDRTILLRYIAARPQPAFRPRPRSLPPSMS